MRLRRTLRLIGAVVLVGAAAVGCSAQAPSDVPAVDALVRSYDPDSGLWPTTGWWNSANALTALTDYMILSGDHRYLWVIQNTYEKKRNAAGGDFINGLIDDTGWWALAWIRAYDLTHNQTYLATARHAVDYMWSYSDDTCGGGLWWTVDRTYKNAVVNELFVKAAAQLDQRLGGNTAYLQHALQTQKWFEASGLINDDGLINDGLTTSTCKNNNGIVWTYNQGVVLGGLVALSQATGNQSYLERARDLADASTGADSLHVDGTLTEPCEATGCGVDGPSFKGIYVRNLGELDRALTDHPYSKYLAGQASTAYEKDRTDDAQYGLHWAGPLAAINGASQQSAVDLLVAARPDQTSGASTVPSVPESVSGSVPESVSGSVPESGAPVSTPEAGGQAAAPTS
jgi:predicted alpha-1,6-mannanase (GH76 family)